MTPNTTPPQANSWQSIIMKYNKPRISSSVWQLINSIVPYILLWVLMVFTLKISFWLTLPLIFLAAGFLTRIFIIFHDCGHGSFFKSKKLNFYIGSACGMMAFTPYHKWTDSHRLHHQTVGNLDKRGLGDVWTLTVDEYLAKSRFKRFVYRFFRHPVVLLGIGPIAIFMIAHRLTNRKMNWKQRINVYTTNAIMLAVASIVSYFIGWQAFLLIQLPVMYFAAIGGIYLFYLQHQYEDVIWCREEDWDYKKMALEGSSFFKLPGLLRWFTGNIGFHHIHHLGPTIPNYNLPKAHNENPIFQEVEAISFLQSFKSLNIRFWDEANQRAVGLRELRKRRSMA
jgi:acyl-lipid omega-6 desaturase (Delta-12 desaturase)